MFVAIIVIFAILYFGFLIYALKTAPIMEDIPKDKGFVIKEDKDGKERKVDIRKEN